ncbi:hypothetical protein [Geodermatophilus sp. URMC 62]
MAATTSATGARRGLAQDEPVGGDVDEGEVGDDPVDAGLAGERARR